MYPFLRLAKQQFLVRNAPPLATGETSVTRHICWPWDLDMFAELNNGRVLTLYDLGRMPIAKRSGLLALLKRERWGFAVAGATVRYRRRVKLFDRIEMRSRVIGWDARNVYMAQDFLLAGETEGRAVARAVVQARFLSKAGERIATADLLDAIGIDEAERPLPHWVTDWAEAKRTLRSEPA